MNGENKKAKKCETIEVVEDAVVVYIEGEKELFDAIRITDGGAIIGRILKTDKTERVCNDCREVFVESGFIPKDNIIRIESGTRRKIYKQKS